MTAAPKDATASPAKTTVTVTTPAFNGSNQPSAEARCPAGMTCTSGAVTPSHPDQVVTASRTAGNGQGWFGSVTGGPFGATAVVSAQCAVPAETAASPSEP